MHGSHSVEIKKNTGKQASKQTLKHSTPYKPVPVNTPLATVNQQFAMKAKSLGYNKVIPANKAPFNSRNQPVYQNGNRYITRDVDSHTGGTWKLFVKKGGNWQREGTYDETLLIRIGK